jgi:hypothetical protein
MACSRRGPIHRFPPEGNRLMNQQHEFQPGQRVRHRYQHWWGTVVRKLENTSETGNQAVTFSYQVTVDGGAGLDDVRPEDLTVS